MNIPPPPKGYALVSAAPPPPPPGYQAVAPAAPKRSLLDEAAGFMTNMNEVIPLADEAAAGVDALRRWGEGKAKDLGEGWRQARDYQLAQQQGYSAAHPLMADLAKGTGYAVQAVPALMSAGATAAPSAAEAAAAHASAAASRSMAARAGRAAIPLLKGATAGAAYAAGNALAGRGDIPQRVRAADASMIPGALVGAAIPAAVGIARAVAGPTRRVAGAVGANAAALKNAVTAEAPEVTPRMAAHGEDQALAFLRDQLERKGVTPEALAANPMAARGITAGEAMGPSTQQEMVSLARRPGATGDSAFDIFTARNADLPQRQIGDIEYHTGISPELARGGVDAVVARGRAEVKPLFDEALAAPGPVWNTDLANLAKRPVIKKAIGAAVDSLLNAGLEPTAPGFAIDPDTGLKMTGEDLQSLIEMQPTARAWDLARKKAQSLIQLDQTGAPITTGQLGEFNRNLMVAGSDLSRALREAVPGYSDALDQSGDYLKVQEASQRAANMLFNNRWSAHQVAEYFHGLGTEPERTAVKQAFARQLYDQADQGTLYASKFTGAGGADRNIIRDKLAAVFRPDAADRMISSIKADWAMTAAGQRIKPLSNSTTGEAQMAAAVHDQAAGEDVARHLRRGNIKGALASAIAPSVNGAVSPGSIAFRDALGRMYLMSPAELQAYLAAHPAPVPRLPPGAVGRAAPGALAPLLTARRPDQP